MDAFDFFFFIPAPLKPFGTNASILSMLNSVFQVKENSLGGPHFIKKKQYKAWGFRPIFILLI